MNGDFISLQVLCNSDGYRVLQALWAHQHRKIVEAQRKAGKKGQESAWRYYAGQLEGFEIAITQVDMAMQEMQKEGEGLDNPAANQVEELLNEIRKENK